MPTPNAAPHHTTTLNLSPSLDVSITSDSKEGDEVISAEWLSALSARVFMDGEPDQFGGSLATPLKSGIARNRDFSHAK